MNTQSQLSSTAVGRLSPCAVAQDATAAPKRLRCRACMSLVEPVIRQRVVAQHQDPVVAMSAFALTEPIACCPKCGERDL